MMPPWVLLWAKTMRGQKVMRWERVGGVFSAFKVNIVFFKILIWEKDTNFKVTVHLAVFSVNGAYLCYFVT